jgi:very-short-patch-repair endonuclease
MHRGVYAVGHRVVSTRGRWMAAVLACGPTAVLSHRAAAALWGLREAGPLEVTAGRERRHPGIRTSMASVPNDERTIRDGIPVTTVARTLLDLAATLDKRQLKRAIHEAEYRRLTDTVPLDALIARYPGRRGITKIERTTAPRLFRSDLEMDFLEFVDAHELPRPATNVDVEGFECDAVWHDQRLVVELDGGGHDLPTRSEEDRLRDRALTVAGWRVVRVSRLSADLARDLRALLRPA